jgi:hypothetical protein
MNTCIELPDLAYPVKVDQLSDGKFRVTYGKQVKTDLHYGAAAHEFGLCVFHALACDGKLNNTSPARAIHSPPNNGREQ